LTNVRRFGYPNVAVRNPEYLNPAISIAARISGFSNLLCTAHAAVFRVGNQFINP
jgi:hypothetical protein